MQEMNSTVEDIKEREIIFSTYHEECVSCKDFGHFVAL